MGTSLCIDQLTATVQSPIIRTSTPALALIIGATPPPVVHLTQAHHQAVAAAMEEGQQAIR